MTTVDCMNNSLQLLAPLKMFVVIDEVISALPQCPWIYASVLTRPGRVFKAKWPAERSGYELLIFSIGS